MSRISIEFMGTVVKVLSVDPAEYAGMTAPQVSAELLKLLADISPDVDFFNGEVNAAAEMMMNPPPAEQSFFAEDVEKAERESYFAGRTDAPAE